MLREILTVVMTPIYTVVFGLPALVYSAIRPGGRAMFLFARPWARAVLKTAGVRVIGVEHDRVDADATQIFLCNHQSNLDVLAILDTLPVSFRIVAKRSLFSIPIFGQCMWLMGMIPIDRGDRERAIASLDRAAERIRSGLSVLFFPEGTRSPDGRLLPFKKGAFVIAERAGVPVVPIAVSGTARLLPRGSVRLRSGTVRIEYGEPIRPELPGRRMEREALMARVRAEMERMLARGERAPGRAEPSSGPAASRAS